MLPAVAQMVFKLSCKIIAKTICYVSTLKETCYFQHFVGPSLIKKMLLTRKVGLFFRRRAFSIDPLTAVQSNKILLL